MSLTVNSTGCGFDTHLRKLHISYLFFSLCSEKQAQSATLRFATKYAMSIEFARKW